MSKRVLIVEDSSAMRAFARAALEQDGDFEVEEASSGFDALRLLPRGHFDAVLVDINMPDINGLELVTLLRKHENHTKTPIVLMSTQASARDRERGLALGADTFLSKPFTAEQLRDALGRVLGGSGTDD